MGAHGFDIESLPPGRFNEIRDEVARRMILQFHAQVASRKFAVKTVRYPADWWQALKERWFPRKWQKRWPVKYTEDTLEANAYYPEIQIPDRQTFVEIVHMSRPFYKDR